METVRATKKRAAVLAQIIPDLAQLDKKRKNDLVLLVEMYAEVRFALGLRNKHGIDAKDLLCEAYKTAFQMTPPELETMAMQLEFLEKRNILTDLPMLYRLYRMVREAIFKK